MPLGSKLNKNTELVWGTPNFIAKSLLLGLPVLAK